MTQELAKTLTTALVQFIDRERPGGTMCCSNSECEKIEKAFVDDRLDIVDGFIQKKLSRLTEFENCFSDYLKNDFDFFATRKWDEQKWNEVIRKQSKELLALAKKELLKDDELGKKHLEGHIKGREYTMREMKDFIESHFNTNKAREGEDLTDLYRKEYAQPLCLRNGGICTNPMRDCINCIPTLERFNTTSGTSTSTLHGNTSATDGKEHNPSFTD